MAAAIRVLYVDDEPEMLEIGKLFLEDSGDFTVTTSLSATNAIRLLELEKFDAIITDYQMPGMDGIQFLIEVRARFGPIPFILFTGRGREKVVIEAINNGVDFYLQKGGDPEPQFAELSHKIKQAASRRKVDNALKKSEENFRAIADYTVNWESWFGPDGKYIWVSPSVAGFTGYSAGEILAMPDFISTVIAKEDRSLFTERFREAIRGTRGENFEFRYLHRNGTKHWLNVSWQPIVDRDGNSFGTRSSGHDITERKQQEEALQESQKRFQALTETTSDFVWEIDSNGVYTYCSPQIHDLWGYKPEDIIGRSPFDLMMPEDREQGIRMFRTISESSGSFKGLETRSRDNTGRIVTLETSGVPFFDINGRLCGYRGISRDITERKQVEESLRKNEGKLQSLFTILPVGVTILDKNRHIVEMNPSMERILSLSKESMIKGDYQQRRYLRSDGTPMPPEEFASNRAITGQTVISDIETGVVKEDGSIIWTSVSAAPLTNDDLSAVIVTTDITERKRTELELASAHERLNEAHHLAHIGIWDWIKETDTVTWSEELYNIAGRDPSLPAPTYTEHPRVYAPASWGRLSSAVTRALTAGEPYNLELELTRPDGSTRWVNAFGGVKYDGNGKATGLHGTVQDITERKRAEDALRESHDRFEATIASLDDAVFLVDPVTRLISECNDATTRIFGYSHEELVGRGTGFLHVDPAHLEQFGREASATYENPGYYRRVFHMRRKDGGVFPTEHFVRPIKDPNGRILYVVSVVRDITGRKKAEDTIRHALAEKEVLLREIHHRVKNNLAGIIALINLQTSSLTDPDQIYLFKDLETRIRSMALVHESLYQTKDIANIRLTTYTENLTRYLFQVYETVTNVRCRIDMGEITMPIETATPCGLVMTEIVTNSLKYAFPKTFSCKEIRGEPCTISISMHREGSDYILTIADNGIGIPEGTDVTMKTSLGLYLIKFIVKHQLQGSTEVSTGNGTAYTIRFPEPAAKERKPDE